MKEGIAFLNQLIKALEDSEMKLEEAYNKKDVAGFNDSKKMILQVQRKISDMLK